MGEQSRQQDKTCAHCQHTYVELYDSYTDKCPECNSEYQGVLSQTEGGWVWQS